MAGVIDMEVEMETALQDPALPQRMAALRDANIVRSRRKVTKDWIGEPRDVKASRERCAEVLLDPPPHVESMAVFDLLRATHMLGRAASQRLCVRAGAAEHREVGALTMRQRALLAAELLGTREMDLRGLVA
jgi:hypothetical protein